MTMTGRCQSWWVVLVVPSETWPAQPVVSSGRVAPRLSKQASLGGAASLRPKRTLVQVLVLPPCFLVIHRSHRSAPLLTQQKLGLHHSIRAWSASPCMRKLSSTCARCTGRCLPAASIRRTCALVDLGAKGLPANRPIGGGPRTRCACCGPGSSAELREGLATQLQPGSAGSSMARSVCSSSYRCSTRSFGR